MHPEPNDFASETRPRMDPGSGPHPAPKAKHLPKVHTPRSVTSFRYDREGGEALRDSEPGTLTSLYFYDPDDESFASVGAGSITRFVYAAPAESPSRPGPDETPSA